MTSARTTRWSPCSSTSTSLHSIQPAAPETTGRPEGLRWVFTLPYSSSRTFCARSSIPSRRNETAKVFERRAFASVRLSWRSASATRGGLNEVCTIHVKNMRWSSPPSVFVPTTYAPDGISCSTLFFAFLSMLSPAVGFVADRVRDAAGPGRPPPLSPAVGFVADRVRAAEGPERLPPLHARGARPAVDVAVPVAGPRVLERHAEREALSHDLDLRLPAAREADLDRGLGVAPEAEAVHGVEE